MSQSQVERVGCKRPSFVNERARLLGDRESDLKIEQKKVERNLLENKDFTFSLLSGSVWPPRTGRGMSPIKFLECEEGNKTNHCKKFLGKMKFALVLITCKNCLLHPQATFLMQGPQWPLCLPGGHPVWAWSRDVVKASENRHPNVLDHFCPWH